MKHKTSKFFALLLSVLMLLGAVPTSAFAAEMQYGAETEWYVWDFYEGSATNTSGSSLDNTLSPAKSGTDISELLVDGILDATTKTSFTLSESITLSSSKNWTVRLVAKGDGTNPIRCFMSTAADLNGVYTYISKDGDLCLVKKVAYTPDGASEKLSTGYTYYKVSNADFAASVLASGEFDITEYHTYDLRCIDGVLSFWLDGTKIGDFALSERTSGRTEEESSTEYTAGNGCPFSFSTLEIIQVGCGSTKDAYSQGLQGTVKSLAFYTDCVYGAEVEDEAYRAEGDSYYTSCVACGASSEGTEFEATFGHHICANNLTLTEGQEPTCTEDGWSAYYSCTCGKYYADAEATEEIERGSWVLDGGHRYEILRQDDATCTSFGSRDVVCSACNHAETQTLYAGSGYTWDFSQGTATTTDGSITLSSYVKNSYTNDFTLEDGTLVSPKSILKMSESVTLDAAKDWVVEIVAKGTAGTAIGTVFSTGSGYSNASFIYINAAGDLMLGKRGSYTADAGTSVSDTFTYYKVSNADYAANVLANGTFDVTEYHTYQLRCVNGVFSFWLDGVKIGNLALTEKVTTRGEEATSTEYTAGNGTPFYSSFKTMKMAYIGNGNSSGSPIFGLNATVKYLGIYTGHTYADGVCSECGAIQHVCLGNLTRIEAQDPTCTENGWTTYYICSCGVCYADEDAAQQLGCIDLTVEKLGHNLIYVEGAAENCTEDGSKDYWYCETCGKFYLDAEATNECEENSWITEKTGHALTHTAAKDATCTADGNKEYWYCANCEAYFADAKATEQYEDGAWIEAKTSHTLTHTAAKDATCTEEGNHEYWYCSGCEAYFADAEANEQYEDGAWIEAKTDHALTHTDAKEATCTEDGNHEYWYCATCEAYYADAEATEQYEDGAWIIAKNSHALTHTDAREATCAKEGNHEYWYCSGCEAYFADEEAIEQYEDGAWSIAKKNHSYGEPVFEWSEDGTSAEAVFTCGNCEEGTDNHTVTKTAAVEILSSNEKDADCKTKVFVTYQATAVLNGVTYTGEKSVFVGFGACRLTYTAGQDATCTEDGNHPYWHCSVCDTYYADKAAAEQYEDGEWIIEKSGHDLTCTAGQDATCTEDGNHAYWYCANCEAYFADAKADEQYEDGAWIIEKSGHDLTCTAGKDATCTEEGNHAYWYCANCEAYFADAKATEQYEDGEWIIAKTNHALTYTTAKEATCTEDGNKEYWYCSGCEAYFADQDATEQYENGAWIEAKTRHDLTHTAAKEAAGCGKPGNSEYWTCEKCEKFFADAKGSTEIKENSWVITVHEWDEGTVTLAATAYKKGIMTYECTVCGETKTEDIPVVTDGMLWEDGTLRCYKDGKWFYAGLIEIDGYYYYIRSNGCAVVNDSYWVTKTNGLMSAGLYEFDEQGRMIIEETTLEGIVEENGALYYYVDGVRTYAGLIKIDEDYYYVRSNGQLVVDTTYWITLTNGLLPAAKYTFDENGKILVEKVKNGIVRTNGILYYYVNGMRTNAGLVKVDGYYYYARTNGRLVVDCEYWITKTNGLLPAATYKFDANGRIILKNGIVDENGTLYYYVDGVRTYAGLIKIDGAYYYVRSNGQVVVNSTYWVTKTNGLLTAKSYKFGADGKMIIK